MEENFFQCNWCQKSYNLQNKLPKMLAQCGHTICFQCLKDNIDNKRDLQCHIDKRIITTKDKTIESFPNNYALISYLKQIRLNSEIVPKKAQEVSIENLDLMTKTSNKDNIYSQKRLCKNESSKFLSESDFQNSINQITQKKLCNDHLKELEIMCVECKKWVCYKCGLFGQHKNHEFINGDEIKQESGNFCKQLINLNEKLKKIDKNIKEQVQQQVFKIEKQKFQDKIQKRIDKIYELALKCLKEKKKNIQKKINQMDQKFEENLNIIIEKEIHVQFKKSLPLSQQLDEIIQQINNKQQSNEKIYIDLKKKNPQLIIQVEDFLIENEKSLSKIQTMVQKFYNNIKIEFDQQSTFGMLLKQQDLDNSQQKSLEIKLFTPKLNFKEEINLLESIKLEDSGFNSINKYSFSNSRIQPNSSRLNLCDGSKEERKNQLKNNSQQTVSKSKSKTSKQIVAQPRPIFQSSREKKLRFSKKKFQYDRNKGIHASKEKQGPFLTQRNYSRKKSDIGEQFKPQRKSLRVRDISSKKKFKLNDQNKNEILDLTNLKLNDNFLVSLNVILGNNKKIKKIILKDNYFTDIGVQKLCDILLNYPNVESIDLSGNILSKKVFYLLSKLVTQNKKLKNVVLKNCQFQQQDYTQYESEFHEVEIVIN